MSRNEGRFQAAEGTPTPEDEGTSAVPASEAAPNTPFNWIVDSRVKVNDLLMGDKNALLVAARVTGYGADYVTNVTCPSCQNVDEHQFDLQNLRFVDIETAMTEHDVHLTERNTLSQSTETRALFRLVYWQRQCQPEIQDI